MHKASHLRSRSSVRVLLVTLFGILIGIPVHADQVPLSKEAYLTPPKEIADAVLPRLREQEGWPRVDAVAWIVDPHRLFKVQCPICKSVFPTNASLGFMCGMGR